MRRPRRAAADKAEVDDQDHRGDGDADAGLDQQDAEVLAADRVIGKHVVLEKLAAQQHALDADGRVQQDPGGREDASSAGGMTRSALPSPWVSA